MKLSHSQFRFLIASVGYADASLRSCTDREVSNESRILRNAVAALCSAELARKCPALIVAQAEAIKSANATLARRVPLSA